MRMHIAQAGKQAGQLVRCPAQHSCTIQKDDEHMDFKGPALAKEYSQLHIAKENGGVFGEGISSREENRLNELKALGQTKPKAREPLSMDEQIENARVKAERRKRDAVRAYQDTGEVMSMEAFEATAHKINTTNSLERNL